MKISELQHDSKQQIFIVLASEYKRTLKYFYSLSRGLVPLKIDWILECVKKSKILNGLSKDMRYSVSFYFKL